MAFFKLEDMQITWKTKMEDIRVYKEGQKGFGGKPASQDFDSSLVNLAMSTEQDTRDLEPEVMDLMTYLNTVADNEQGAKAIMISTEQFIF